MAGFLKVWLRDRATLIPTTNEGYQDPQASCAGWLNLCRPKVFCEHVCDRSHVRFTPDSCESHVDVRMPIPLNIAV